jgi:hypothetical protein
MPYQETVPTIPMHEIEWELTGEIYPAARRNATIQIGPVRMHLEGIEVEDELLMAVDPMLQSSIDGLDMIDSTRWQTHEIDGRQYVLFATPYGA